jgi:dihydroneopterin aldolase
MGEFRQTETKVIVEKLRLAAHIGCTTGERSATQPLVISLSIETDPAVEWENIELAHSVNYHSASKLVARLVTSREWVLVEHVAVHIGKEILRTYKTAQAVHIKVHKFAVPDVEWTGVTLRMTRSE